VASSVHRLRSLEDETSFREPLGALKNAPLIQDMCLIRRRYRLERRAHRADCRSDGGAIRQRGVHRGANHRTRRPPTKAPTQPAPIQIHGHVPNITRHRLALSARDSFRARLQSRLYQTSSRLHPASFLGAGAGEATVIFWTRTCMIVTHDSRKMVTSGTATELQKVTAWPENLVIMSP
jgi:hypothetical protein